ncbi:DUF4238 domain-containing protein [Vibrio alginolyticus]|uniref:DUF4238 domain-containing protein n=1 Tax=Vibrio alginolyticus TaxID=663 RepID=UPI001BD562B8|nr:DUF4238 domain-containing protein [Vibrio alginolyticus]
MGRKAKHHYIPKCYLKGFTAGGENSSRFICVPTDNSPPFPTSPNDSCAQRDYYSIEHENSLIVENWYAEQIEPNIGKVLQYIKETSTLPPANEMRHLILLLATLYLRVPSFRSTLEAPMKRTKEIIDSMGKMVIDGEIVKVANVNISNQSDFEYSKTDLIKTELRLIDTVQASLANKFYQLYVVEDKDLNLVTSDCPFILSHPNGGWRFHFGLNTPNIEICVPLTKKVLLIARNEPLQEGTFSATEQLIGLTNTKTILNANQYFYACNKNVLLVDDNISAHTHTIDIPNFQNGR